MLSPGVPLWLVLLLLLPFVLFSYAIFLAIENRKPTYKALLPRTIIAGVAGIAILGLVSYQPFKANYTGISTPAGPAAISSTAIPSSAAPSANPSTRSGSVAGQWVDNTKGARLFLSDVPPRPEPGWSSFGTGTMVLSSQNFADNFAAGYRILSFQAAGIVDVKKTGNWFGSKASGDWVLEFKIRPPKAQPGQPVNPFHRNYNLILRQRLRIKDNELTLLPIDGDESNPNKILHLVKG
jgi:hypothetical protein